MEQTSLSDQLGCLLKIEISVHTPLKVQGKDNIYFEIEKACNRELRMQQSYLVSLNQN